MPLTMSPRTARALLRAAGGIGAAAWAGLSMVERAAWPCAGVLALGASLAVAAALRPIGFLPRALLAPSRRVFVASCAVVASGISWWLTRYWLRTMPGVIDGGVYLMQARAMAHLHFGMRVPEPLQAFSNHFVLEGPDRRLYGVFPPGWPLAIVPFVWAGAPMLIGPVLAALLVIAQATLGRVLGQAAGDPDAGEVATRVSLLISLTSYARAIQTADLMSHGLVALLAAAAMTCAIRLTRLERPGTKTWRAAALVLGGCVGWAMAARILDGIVLGLAMLCALAWSRQGRRAVGWGFAGAAPFVILLLVEQRCATGSWLLPTQTIYFERSDWPPTCHRLGLGADVGCTVEHASVVASFGSGGYDFRAALHTARERATVLGADLLGFPPLMLLAFAPLALGASAVDGLGIAFLLAMTVGYGLFYYENATIYGARHLFPAAPLVWLLASRASVYIQGGGADGFRNGRRAQAAACFVLVVVAGVCALPSWQRHGQAITASQADRSDLRRSLALRDIDRAIVLTRDQAAVAAAFDSWTDGDARLFAVDDGSRLLELRRAHPGLPFLVSLPGDQLGTLFPPAPPANILIELERTWPTFVRPSGLGANRVAQEGASGGAVLRLSHAQPGAEVVIPFETAARGDYQVRVVGFVGSDQGDYAIRLDGASLPDWHGYDSQSGPRWGEPTPFRLNTGRHVLLVRCIGQDPKSAGSAAMLDQLVGEPR
jgi:hypothetical protein